jgi:hypothetical protein
MTELDPRIRQTLIAARDSTRATDAGHGASESSRGRRLPQSTRVRTLGAEQLARMGFDATSVERELVAERAESHRRLGSSRRMRSPGPLLGRTPCNAWSIPGVRRWRG